jgi:hypothetical protein
MNAVPAEGPEIEQNHNDVSKNQAIKIEFNNADGEHPLSIRLLPTILLTNVRKT